MKKKSHKDTHTETRYVGEWETHIAKRGTSITRKVKSTGNVEYVLPAGAEESFSKLLREGKEITLCFRSRNGAAKPIVRFYAVMKTDFSGMYVSAQTLGEFRTETLEGITSKIIQREQAGDHKPHEVSAKEANGMWRGINDKRRNEAREKREWVSPDTVVECPKCGYEFRVGRPNKE